MNKSIAIQWKNHTKWKREKPGTWSTYMILHGGFWVCYFAERYHTHLLNHTSFVISHIEKWRNYMVWTKWIHMSSKMLRIRLVKTHGFMLRVYYCVSTFPKLGFVISIWFHLGGILFISLESQPFWRFWKWQWTGGVSSLCRSHAMALTTEKTLRFHQTWLGNPLN